MTELLRFRWTSHGPMLDENGPFVLFVDSEAAIDEARSQEAKVHAATERWSPLSYLQGQRDMLARCIASVETYAEERLTVTKNPNMSDDITAALRVAVNRLRALQEKPPGDQP